MKELGEWGVDSDDDSDDDSNDDSNDDSEAGQQSEADEWGRQCRTSRGRIKRAPGDTPEKSFHIIVD